MVVVFGGEKGGTGKTTLSTNITAMLAARGEEVLLIDTDKQESASSWASIRTTSPRIPCILKFGTSVREEIHHLKTKYKNIIVDCGGRDSAEFRAALLIADKAIIPMRPTQFDLWTLGKVNSMVSDVLQINAGLKASIVINASNTNPSVTEQNDAKLYAEGFEYISLAKTIIKDRIAFHKAASDGKSVEEITPIDQKAVAEVYSLYKEIFNEIF